MSSRPRPAAVWTLLSILLAEFARRWQNQQVIARWLKRIFLHLDKVLPWSSGTKGGMTDGMPIVIRGAMKPISTLLQGMPSVNLETKEAERSDYERSDVCALPAASVVMENVVGFEVARAFLEKFGGDTMDEVGANYHSYLEQARSL